MSHDFSNLCYQKPEEPSNEIKIQFKNNQSQSEKTHLLIGVILNPAKQYNYTTNINSHCKEHLLFLP